MLVRLSRSLRQPLTRVYSKNYEAIARFKAKPKLGNPTELKSHQEKSESNPTDESAGDESRRQGYLRSFAMISNAVNYESKHTDIDELHPSTPQNKVTKTDWIRDKEEKIRQAKEEKERQLKERKAKEEMEWEKRKQERINEQENRLAEKFLTSHQTVKPMEERYKRINIDLAAQHISARIQMKYSQKKKSDFSYQKNQSSSPPSKKEDPYFTEKSTRPHREKKDKFVYESDSVRDNSRKAFIRRFTPEELDEIREERKERRKQRKEMRRQERKSSVHIAEH